MDSTPVSVEEKLIQFFIKHLFLILLLFMSLALAASFLVLKEQANPFFYAGC
jgi:hypothetical protein